MLRHGSTAEHAPDVDDAERLSTPQPSGIVTPKLLARVDGENCSRFEHLSRNLDNRCINWREKQSHQCVSGLCGSQTVSIKDIDETNGVASQSTKINCEYDNRIGYRR